jgi:hypothetical protein
MGGHLEALAGERAWRWFPIHQEVHYQCVKGSRISAIGAGRTLEMCSREVRFTIQQPLKAGQSMRVTVAWPALLDNRCRMNLELYGWIVNCEHSHVNVRIERYEFKTRSAAASIMRR